MPDTPKRLYFAYGSNINLNQMAYRCPDAEVVSPVTLNGYRLLFRGVATIVPEPTKQVKGLLWRLTPACEESLDRYEGYPSYYEKQDVTVMDKAGKQYTVMAYVMTRSLDRPPSYPSFSYYAGIAKGFDQNSIPRKTLTDALNYCKKEVAAFEKQHGSFLRDTAGDGFSRAGKPKDHER